MLKNASKICSFEFFRETIDPATCRTTRPFTAPPSVAPPPERVAITGMNDAELQAVHCLPLTFYRNFHLLLQILDHYVVCNHFFKFQKKVL